MVTTGFWPGASKNKRALIGSFKGKIPSRREVSPANGWCATTPEWQRDVQREDNATWIRLLLNHDSCFAHVDSFRRKKRTSLSRGWRKQNAGQKVYTKTRICLSFPLLGDPLCPFFFFFFTRKKGPYVFDSLVGGEKGRGRESLNFFLTLGHCYYFLCFSSPSKLQKLRG